MPGFRTTVTLFVAAWLIAVGFILLAPALDAQSNAARFARVHIQNGSNAERGFLRWASNVFEIGQEANGGAPRLMRFIVPNGQSLRISADGNNSDLLQITTTGVEFFAAGVWGGIEQTAPAAPAANGYRIFAEDTGGGKTRLCVRFATGAAQCFATEP